jgi:hypothetical protein
MLPSRFVINSVFFIMLNYLRAQIYNNMDNGIYLPKKNGEKGLVI